MEWATEQELDHARNTAEEGLRQLVAVSRYANNYQLNEHPKEPAAIAAQIAYAEEIVSNILPTIKNLSEYITWCVLSDEGKGYKKAVRTIERAWAGDPVRPFANHEVSEGYLYITAHQTVIDWTASFVGWVENGIGRSREKPVEPKDLPAFLLEACQFIELRPGQEQTLAIRIVQEWQATMEWVSQRPAIEPEENDAQSVPPAKQEATQLTEAGDTAADNEEEKPFVVLPETDKPSQDTIAKNDLLRMQLAADWEHDPNNFLDALKKHIELNPDESEEPQTVKREPMRFDPKQWVMVASKEIIEEVDIIGEAVVFGTDTLYTNNNQSTWIAVTRLWHIAFDSWENNTYRELDGTGVSEWFVDCEETPRIDIGDIIAERTLTPDSVQKPATSIPCWNDGKLSVGGLVIATIAPKAKNQRPILDAFQEEAWPEKIDDPLPGGHTDPSGRLRETVRALNNKQEVIEFSADGTGEGIRWKLRVSSVGDNSGIAPTEPT